MANTAQLNLTIRAIDEASDIFKQIAATMKSIVSELGTNASALKEALTGVSQTTQATAENTSSNQQKEREELYLTRSELLDWARQHTSAFEDARAAENNFADVATSDLKRVYQATEDAKVRILADLNGIADTTDGKAVSSLNKYKETVVMTTEQLKARFSEIVNEYNLTGLAALKYSDDNAAAMKKVIQDVTGVNVILNKAKVETKDTFDSMAVIASAQVTGASLSSIGTSIVGFSKNAVEAGAAFDQQVDAVSATLASHNGQLKVTAEQYNALKQKALDLGQTGYFSANQVAEGMYTLARQGIDYQNIMGGAIESVQNLAVATDSDLTSTANVVSDIVHEMGGELSKEFGENLTSQFTGVANMISGAMHNARMSMDDFLNTLKYVGPQASAMGMSLADVSTAIALLGEHGIKASQAGTTLRRMLSDLAPTTKPAREEMEKLGIITADGTNKFFDATGKLKSFAEIQQVLQDAMKGLTDAEQEQAIKTMFGQYALSGMSVIANATKEDLDKLNKEVTSSSTASDLAAAKWDNSAGAIRRAQAHYETLKKEIGEALLPVVNMLLEKVQGMLTWFDNLSPGVKTAIIDFGVFGGIITLVAGKIFSLVGNIGFFVKSLEGFKTLNTVASLLKMTTTVAGEAAVATESVGAAATTSGGLLAALTGPVGIAVLAIAGLGVAFYEAYKHSENFRTNINNTVNAVKETATKVKEFFWGKDYIKDIQDASNKSVAEVVKLANDTETKLITLRASVGAISNGTANDAISASNKMRDMSIKAADDRMNREIQDAQYLKQNLVGITDQQVAQIVQNAHTQRDKTVQAAQELNKKVVAQIEEMKRAGVNVTDGMKTDLIRLFEMQRDGAIKAVSDTEIQAKTIIEKLHAESGQITAQMAADTIKNANKQRDEAIAAANKQYDETVKKIIQMRDETGIISAAQAEDLIKKAKKQRDDSIQAAEEMHTRVVDEVEKMAGSNIKLVDESTGQMKTKWQLFKEDVTRIVSETWGKIKSDFQNAWNELETNAVKAWSNLKTSASEGMNNAWKEIQNVWQSVTAWFEGLPGKALQWGKDIFNSFVSGIKSVHIPLPHFNLVGSFSLMPPSVPTLSVNWYGTGGIFNSPQIIGVGEAGPEAVIPIDRLADLLSDRGVNMFSTRSTHAQTVNINVTVNGAGKSGTGIGNDIVRAIRLNMPVVAT